MTYSRGEQQGFNEACLWVFLLHDILILYDVAWHADSHLLGPARPCETRPGSEITTIGRPVCHAGLRGKAARQVVPGSGWPRERTGTPGVVRRSDVRPRASVLGWDPVDRTCLGSRWESTASLVLHPPASGDKYLQRGLALEDKGDLDGAERRIAAPTSGAVLMAPSSSECCSSVAGTLRVPRRHTAGARDGETEEVHEPGSAARAGRRHGRSRGRI